VVASEVKNLATQTGRATQDIGAQIGQIQAATQQAVAAIQGIVDVISRPTASPPPFAAAVEEQGAATKEIARSVHGRGGRHAGGQREHRRRQPCRLRCRHAAAQVLGAATGLSANSARLSEAVRVFTPAFGAA